MTHRHAGRQLAFLVGAPRSGTTWLQRMLAAHPFIVTGQESHLFSSFIGPQLRAWRRFAQATDSERGGLGPGCYHREEEYLSILHDYAIELLKPILDAPADGQLFLEKTPGHALFMPEISQVLPEARFIHLIRDATDVVASLLTAATSWGGAWAPRDARKAAELWVQHVRAARSVGREIGERRYLEIHYEDLHTRGVETLQTVFGFLGLPADEASLRRFLAENNAEALRSGGGTPIPVGGAFAAAGARYVREPKGFIGKARPGEGSRRLSVLQRGIVRWVAGQTLTEMGYPRPAQPDRGSANDEASCDTAGSANLPTGPHSC